MRIGLLVTTGLCPARLSRDGLAVRSHVLLEGVVLHCSLFADHVCSQLVSRGNLLMNKPHRSAGATQAPLLGEERRVRME